MAQLAKEIIIALVRIPLRRRHIIGHPMPLQQKFHAGGTGELLGPATERGKCLHTAVLSSTEQQNRVCFGTGGVAL